MDLKVCGKLLTHHRRGYGVGVEALRDGIPSGGLPKKAPDGISRVQKVATVEIGFRGAPGCFRGIWVYIGGRSRLVELRGAHVGGRHAYPLGAPSCLVASSRSSRLPHQVSWVAFVPRKILAKVSFHLDSVWYSFSAKHSNRQKTAICIGPLVNRLVPK